MEGPKKKLRALKATKSYLKYKSRISSRVHEQHNAFATGKLLGVRRKTAHDAQWQKLTEKLNGLDGPSKSMDGWKMV